MKRASHFAFLAFAATLPLWLPGCNDDHPQSTERNRAQTVGPRAKYERQFAIVIGVNKHASANDGRGPLEFAVNDAVAIDRVLRDEFAYDAKHVRLLLDEEATKENVENAFQDWLGSQRLVAEDSVLVFFSGHGTVDGYLVASDSDVDDAPGSCISVSWLVSSLSSMPCLHKLVILDSCYSGALFDAADASRDAPSNSGGSRLALSEDNLSYYFSRPAFLGMSAGRETPVVGGTEDEQLSVFTAALITVLLQRASSERSDYAFTFRQMAAQVEAMVGHAATSDQIPAWGRLAPGDGDFVFRPTIVRTTPPEQAKRMEEMLKDWMERQARQRNEIEKITAKSERLQQTMGALRSLEQQIAVVRELDAPIPIELDTALQEKRSTIADLAESLSVSLRSFQTEFKDAVLSDADGLELRLAAANAANAQARYEEALRLTNQDIRAEALATDQQIRREVRVNLAQANAFHGLERFEKELERRERIQQLSPHDLENTLALALCLARLDRLPAGIAVLDSLSTHYAREGNRNAVAQIAMTRAGLRIKAVMDTDDPDILRSLDDDLALAEEVFVKETNHSEDPEAKLFLVGLVMLRSLLAVGGTDSPLEEAKQKLNKANNMLSEIDANDEETESMREAIGALGGLFESLGGVEDLGRLAKSGEILVRDDDFEELLLRAFDETGDGSEVLDAVKTRSRKVKESSFFSFLGLSFGDTPKKAHELFGLGLNPDDLMSPKRVCVSQCAPFQLFISVRREAIPKLRAKGIDDPKLEYLGCTPDAITKFLKKPQEVDTRGDFVAKRSLVYEFRRGHEVAVVCFVARREPLPTCDTILLGWCDNVEDIDGNDDRSPKQRLMSISKAWLMQRTAAKLPPPVDD